LSLEHNELIRQLEISQQMISGLSITGAALDGDIEEKKEVPNAEIQVYQKKAKHLRTANQSESAIASINVESRFFPDRQNQHFVSAFSDKIVSSLKSDENGLLLQNDSLMANNRTKHDNSISRMREGSERISDAKVAEAEQREELLTAQMEEKRIRETAELERRNNEQIRALQAKHAAANERVKRFFFGVARAASGKPSAARFHEFRMLPHVLAPITRSFSASSHVQSLKRSALYQKKCESD
jgi:hypothetical protein